MRWQRRGKGYSVNVPLKDGMTDEAYTFLFRPVMRRVMEIYQPEVIVFQSGAVTPCTAVRPQAETRLWWLHGLCQMQITTSS